MGNKGVPQPIHQGFALCAISTQMAASVSMATSPRGPRDPQPTRANTVSVRGLIRQRVMGTSLYLDRHMAETF